MCQSILFWAHCFVILCSWSCVCSKCWEICQSFCSELTTSWYFVHSVVIVNDVWKWWYLRGLFAEFMDSPYYSKLELCRGAVIISFSEHLPWQTVHFLQCSTHFSMLQIVDHFKIFCLGAPFSWLEKPRNCTGRDLNWILCLAWKKWIDGIPLEHLPYNHLPKSSLPVRGMWVKWRQHIDSVTENMINVACKPLKKELRLYSHGKNFQWYTCYRIAQNHSTLASKISDLCCF